MLTHPPLTFSTRFVIQSCLVLTCSMVLLQVVGVYVVALFYFGYFGSDVLIQGSQNGTVVGLSVLLTALMFMPALWVLLAPYVRGRLAWRRLLAWQGFGLKGLGLSVLWLLGFIIVSELVMTYFGQSPMDFMDDLLNADSFWVLMIAVVVIAPIYEELVFRGAMFGVLEHRGKLTASLISSGLFAFVHLQYNWQAMIVVFGLGVLFCAVRIRWGLPLAIVIHILNNVIAMGFYLVSL